MHVDHITNNKYSGDNLLLRSVDQTYSENLARFKIKMPNLSNSASQAVGNSYIRIDDRNTRAKVCFTVAHAYGVNGRIWSTKVRVIAVGHCLASDQTDRTRTMSARRYVRMHAVVLLAEWPVGGGARGNTLTLPQRSSIRKQHEERPTAHGARLWKANDAESRTNGPKKRSKLIQDTNQPVCVQLVVATLPNLQKCRIG